MRRLLLAAALAALATTTAPAADAPPYFRGVYVTPTNRPVSQYTSVRTYVNGQAVERTVARYFNNPAPRYVDRPGVIAPAAARVYQVPAYPVITGSWSSPSAYQP
jgi:hypothetical protein